MEKSNRCHFLQLLSKCYLVWLNWVVYGRRYEGIKCGIIFLVYMILQDIQVDCICHVINRVGVKVVKALVRPRHCWV